MTTETPRTTALIADIVQNPGLEWTRAEVEQLGEHAFQLERELEQALADKRRIDWLEQHAVTLEVESPRQYLRFSDIRAAIDAAAMPNVVREPSRTHDTQQPET